MDRPLRIEFPGALYHITSRGIAQRDIFLNDANRIRFLNLLSQAVSRYDWCCHVYCLMDNHYHLLIEASKVSLSEGMKYLNGSYTQSFNKMNQRFGYVFQVPYEAIQVETESHLLELTRHIVLNPVRAQMVSSAKEWPWSSYRATAGHTETHPCLTTDWLLSILGKTRSKAQTNYRAFVAEGRNQLSSWVRPNNHIYLGYDQFVEDM